MQCSIINSELPGVKMVWRNGELTLGFKGELTMSVQMERSSGARSDIMASVVRYVCVCDNSCTAYTHSISTWNT